jgi:hypothetical protein
MNPGFETGFRIYFHCCEDGESKLPRNFGTCLTAYTVSYSSRVEFFWNHSLRHHVRYGEPDWRIRHSDKAADRTVRGSILGTGNILFLQFYDILPHPKRPDRLWSQHSILSWYRGSFPRVQRSGVKLRMSGAVPLLPLYTFMARTGRTLPFTKSIVTLWQFRFISNADTFYSSFK